MKSLFQLLSITALAFLLAACSSGKKALQHGDYDKAVYQAVQKLRSNDDHKKATATLAKAYRYALQMHLSKVETAKQSNDPMKWEAIAYHYASVNSMYEEIMRCPGCRDVVPNPNKYDSELANANKFAAANRYDMGVAAMANKKDRNKAIEAHQHFLRAQEFVPRYKDIEDKLKESLYYAQLKVVVEPIPTPYKAVTLSHEFFVNKIYEYLHHNNLNDYVRFYTPQEAKNIEFIDHVVRMEFDGFNLGNVYNNKTIREVSRDSVVIAKKDNQPIYGTVKATITEYQKSITSGGVLDFRIFDNNVNKVITQEKFPSEYVWTTRWANFKGDERALNDKELEMCDKQEVPIPGPQWMFEEFTVPLYDQVINKLRAYYRNY